MGPHLSRNMKKKKAFSGSALTASQVKEAYIPQREGNHFSYSYLTTLPDSQHG